MNLLADIHRIAWRVRERLSWESLLNCGAISTAIRDSLRDHGIPAEIWVGDVTTDARRRPFGEEHAWVRVPSDAVQDVDGDVVLDGSLDQFCIQNLDEGRVTVQLGPRESFDTVEVFVVGESADYDQWYLNGEPERGWNQSRWESTVRA